MNRVGLGLAVGAGYLLGRTKKMKLAVAVGTAVAGKRMNLSPKMLADLASQQLKANPQFKEIGDQLRQDLRGVGKAASGALVERQIDALADRLHGRTAQVRDQLSGVVPGASGRDAEDEEPDEDEEPEAGEPEDSEPRDEDEGERRAPSRTPAKKTAKKAPAKKAPAKKTAAGAAAAKSAGKRAAGVAGAARKRLPKGGGER